MIRITFGSVSGITPGGTDVPGINPRWSMCKKSVITLVLSLWFRVIYFKSWFDVAETNSKMRASNLSFLPSFITATHQTLIYNRCPEKSCESASSLRTTFTCCLFYTPFHFLCLISDKVNLHVLLFRGYEKYFTMN